ncbi:MAG: hypothetical protein ULS35scaffold63_45 [Phage 33_17]|nr:MAG: hypothetical protein ULS35scaffold63_45 [Phage 33_17]
MPKIQEIADLFNYIFLNKRKLEKKLKALIGYDKTFFDRHRSLPEEQFENLYKIYAQKLLVTYIEKKKDIFLDITLKNQESIFEDVNCRVAIYSSILEVATNISNLVGYYEEKFLKTTIAICKEELTYAISQSITEWLEYSTEDFANNEVFDQARIIIVNDNSKALELIIDLIAAKIKSSDQIKDIIKALSKEAGSSGANHCIEYILEHYHHLRAYLTQPALENQEVLQLVNLPSANIEVNDYINIDNDEQQIKKKSKCCNIL